MPTSVASAAGLTAIGRLDRLHTLQLNDLIGLDDTCIDALVRGAGVPPAAALSGSGVDHAGESHSRESARLTKLLRLELRGAEITSAGVALVATIGSLQHLNLAGCEIDDRGVAELTALKNLRTLDLSDNRDITDAAVDALRGMTALQQLSVVGTSMTVAAAERLRARLPHCDVRTVAQLGSARP